MDKYDLILFWHHALVDDPLLSGDSRTRPDVAALLAQLGRSIEKRPSVGVLVYDNRVGLASWLRSQGLDSGGLPDANDIRAWGAALVAKIPFTLKPSIHFGWTYKHASFDFAPVPLREAGQPEWARDRRPPWPGLIRAGMAHHLIYDGRRVLVVGDRDVHAAAASRAAADYLPVDEFVSLPEVA